MHKDKKTGKIGIIVTIILLTILVILTNIDITKFSYAENITNKLVMPIQNGLTYLKNKIAKNNGFFEDINNLKSENKELKEKVESLSRELSELQIIKTENKTLREYANLSDQYTKYSTIPAYIIDRDFSNLNDTIIINVGTNDGIKANMPVVSADGLVGHIISVTKNTAKVQLIIDSASSVSAMMSISRDNVIAKGELNSDNKLKITYINNDADLIIDDDVETSGIGGIYPKGLKIGTLKEVVEGQNITEKYGVVETAVDFSKLETVLVIVEEN